MQVRLHRDFEAWRTSETRGGRAQPPTAGTGDGEVDADVRAFYEARGKLVDDGRAQ